MNHPSDHAQVTGYSGLRVSGRNARGAVTLGVKEDKVYARDQRGQTWQEPALTIASRSGRWMDIEQPNAPLKRTVGFLHVSVHRGRLRMVNILPVETYVLGVVNGELGSLNFSPESLKAQIVASRSFVLASKSRHAGEGFDFCDGPHCQVFDGTAEITQEFKVAMDETRGQFLSYNGQAVPGYFHDNCGGQTASVHETWGLPDAPYLQGVIDGYCRSSPRAHWVFRADRQTLRKCLRRAGWIQDNDALDTIRVVTYNTSGRADQVCIESNHSKWVSASAFRRTLGRYYKTEALHTTLFEVAREKNEFVFTGRGWGHGVGLCQWGAIEMARAGKSYREILTHYYPGTDLDRVAAPQYVLEEFSMQALR